MAGTARFSVDASKIPPINEDQVHPSLRDMTEDEALTRLAALVEVPGMLRIVTSECVKGPNCLHDDVDPDTGQAVRVHDESDYPVTDHRHFVVHDVVSIDQDERGWPRANSAEGDWVVTPAGARSLLRKLMEVNR